MSEHGLRLLAGLLTAAIAVVVVGVTYDRPATLADHARRLWEARKDRNWAVVFDYQHPDLIGGASVDEYVEWASGNEPFLVHDYVVHEVLQDGRYGWVRVTSSSTLRNFEKLPPQTTTSWQRWLRSDGVWRPAAPGQFEHFPESPALRDLDEEPKLLERFEAAWAAREQSRWSTLHEMIDPRDQPQIDVDGLYGIDDRLKFIDAELNWVQVIGEHGQVDFIATTRTVDPSMTKLPPTKKVIKEKWIKRDGVWYLDVVTDAENTSTGGDSP